MTHPKIRPEKHKYIVIGAGWSGIEAASAIAQQGKEVLVVINNLDSIGWIQDPEQNRNIKLFKTLGKTSSVAAKVLSNNSLSDRWEIARRTKGALDEKKNLFLRQDTIERVQAHNSAFKLKGSSGQEYVAEKLVLCAGTFIGATADISGNKINYAGRDGEIAINNLKEDLRSLGVTLNPTKTMFRGVYKTKDDKFSSEGGMDLIVPPYKVNHYVVEKKELTEEQEHRIKKNIYFAGKCAQAESVEEAALQGLVAGLSAAGKKKEAIKIKNVSRETLKEK